MKIVFVSHSPGTGGAEHSLVTLVSAALERNHSVMLSLPTAPLQKIRDILPASERLNIVSHRWVRMMQGRLPRLSGPLRVAVGYLDARRFAAWLRDESVDLVVVNSTTIPHASLAARMAGVPAITMIREAIRTNPSLPSFLPKPVIAWLIRRWSTETIAVSQYVSRQLGSATHVVYPEVPVPELSQSSKAHQGLRIVMAGTLSREKGQWDAVEAVRIARERGADVRLDLYGQAAHERLADLNTTIENAGLSGVVRHRGESRSMIQLFESADISIVCSRNEAFGRVTAESINAGTPVIGYALGGTSEILSRGGGLLCDPDPTALAERIVQVASDRELLHDLKADCATLNRAGGLGGSATTVLSILEGIAERHTGVRLA